MALQPFEDWLKNEANFQIELPREHGEYGNLKGLKEYLSDWLANVDKKEVNIIIKDLVNWLKGYDSQPSKGMSPMDH
jgi:hypothetical protein